MKGREKKIKRRAVVYEEMKEIRIRE